jgi:death-on-curing protein
MPPVFLTLDEILKIHKDQITRYGGDPGIRDIDLLLSAIGTPAAGIRDRYLHRDLFEMAAAYLIHIVQDHPFVDGNNRTGVVAALIFLELNSIEIELEEAKLEKVVRSVAEGKREKSKLIEFLRGGATQ